MGCLNELFTAGDLLLSEPERARYAMEDSLEIQRYQEWDEAKHPRAEDGKFGSGDGEEDESEDSEEDESDRDREAREKAHEKESERLTKKHDKELENTESRHEQELENFKFSGESEDEMHERQSDEQEAHDEAWDKTLAGKEYADLLEREGELTDEHDTNSQILENDIKSEVQAFSEGKTAPWSAEERQDAQKLQEKFWKQREDLESRHKSEMKLVRDRQQELEEDKKSSGPSARHDKEESARQVAEDAEQSELNKRHEKELTDLEAKHEKESDDLYHEMIGRFEESDEPTKYMKAHFALRKLRKSQYAKDDSERWITLNGGSGEDGHGGTRVKVRGDEIVAGPAGLAKKGVKSLNDLGKGKEEAKKEPPAPKSPDEFRQQGEMSPEMRAAFEANERRLDKVDQLHDAHQHLVESHGAGHPATRAVKKSLDDLRGDTASRKANLAAKKRQARMKALPPFQRQMVEGLWEEHEARNPGASREEFEDFLLSPKQALTNPGSQLTTGEPSTPKGPPPRKAKTPAKRDPKDNLWPYVGLDKSKPPEQPFHEMTEFEPEAKPAAQAPPPRRDTRTVADLDRELAGISQQAEDAKAARKATKATLWQSFQGMLGKMLKQPDQAEYEPGAFGTMQRLIAKSLHAKRGRKELYQKQAFNIFVEEMQRFEEPVNV